MSLSRILRRARAYCNAGLPIPLDLFAAMHEHGIDVDEFVRSCRA